MEPSIPTLPLEPTPVNTFIDTVWRAIRTAQTAETPVPSIDLVTFLRTIATMLEQENT